MFNEDSGVRFDSPKTNVWGGPAVTMHRRTPLRRVSSASRLSLVTRKKTTLAPPPNGATTLKGRAQHQGNRL